MSHIYVNVRQSLQLLSTPSYCWTVRQLQPLFLFPQVSRSLQILTQLIFQHKSLTTEIQGWTPRHCCLQAGVALVTDADRRRHLDRHLCELLPSVSGTHWCTWWLTAAALTKITTYRETRQQQEENLFLQVLFHTDFPPTVVEITVSFKREKMKMCSSFYCFCTKHKDTNPQRSYGVHVIRLGKQA